MAEKKLVWLHNEVRTPPFSTDARRNAGYLLRLLQEGMVLSMPNSRPMPSVARRCHELRLRDAETRVTWRIIYRIDHDAIVIGDVFAKKTRATPSTVVDICRRRFQHYDQTVQ